MSLLPAAAAARRVRTVLRQVAVLTTVVAAVLRVGFGTVSGDMTEFVAVVAALGSSSGRALASKVAESAALVALRARGSRAFAGNVTEATADEALLPSLSGG